MGKAVNYIPLNGSDYGYRQESMWDKFDLSVSSPKPTPIKKDNPYSQSIKETCDMLNRAISDYNFAYERVHELDGLKNDILHSLELDGLNYEERAKLATKLTKLLQERREFKDIVATLTPLVEFLQSDRGATTLNLLKEVLGKTRKVENYMCSCTYRKRCTKDILK